MVLNAGSVIGNAARSHDSRHMPNLLSRSSPLTILQVWFIKQVMHLWCRVIESKNKDFAVGDFVVGGFGWRTHTIVSAGAQDTYKMDPPLPENMRSLGLGALGMPG